MDYERKGVKRAYSLPPLNYLFCTCTCNCRNTCGEESCMEKVIHKEELRTYGKDIRRNASYGMDNKKYKTKTNYN